MDIQITKEDAMEIWDIMGLSSEKPILANDQCWMDEDSFFRLYEFEGLVIRAVYSVIDPNGEMDTYNFADWDNPDYLAVVGGVTPEDL